MKKILLTLLVLMASATGIQAQDLFYTVRDKATAIINNPASPDEEIQVNQFKVTALNYIKLMVEKRGLTKDTYFYDSQAVSLTSFITDFRDNLRKYPNRRSEILKIYTDASKANPLFKDTDKEKVNSYVYDKTTQTPFSFDTDWEKAYDQTVKQTKAILK